MYILIVSRGYPSEKYKMNGIFEFDQAKALAQAGQKVIYAAIDLRSIRRTRQWGYESFKKDGVQIEAINIPCGRIPKKLLDKTGIIALKKLYKRITLKYGEPDVIHAHFIGIGYIMARVFEKSEIPLVLTEHLSGMNKTALSPYLLKLGEYTYHRMNQVITVSNALANNIKCTFGVQAITIPNILDTTNFQYKEEQKNEGFYFVSTGSLTVNKRMDFLISAFNKAFKRKREIKLYIYGEGPERSKLQKMIYRFGLDEQVFLMGQVDRKEIARKMSESQSFVLASRRETFGVAYIEAMAMGLPVIATGCGGPEDFVTKENGVIIPIDNSDALVDALKTMYEKVSVFGRNKISDDTKERFGPDSIAKQLVKVYERIK